MKVLKDNYNEIETINDTTIEPYPRSLICERCGSELEYEKSDLRIGFLGCAHIDCPCCGAENMIEDNENNIDLTFNNIKFPNHFWHTSKETGALDVCNTEEIRDRIERAIRYFRNNKNEYDWYSSCGNLYVNVHRYEGDEIYDITISNDFYTTEIPFEEEDY